MLTRSLGRLTLMAVVLLSGPAVLGQELNPAVEARVKRATVMVLLTIPGKEGGGSGSGSFLNTNGLVITNNHVVDLAHGKSVAERSAMARQFTTPVYYVVADSGTPKEKKYKAKLLYQMESADVALLQAEDDSGEPIRTLNYLPLAPEETITQDTKLWAIGFPGGEARSKAVNINAGLVTKITRSPSGAVTYLETDATVNPGNSGGPMVDQYGRQAGVVAHKRFEEGQKDRSGAVPLQMVKPFIRRAFVEDRMPIHTDVVPFVHFFTDAGGTVSLPKFPRNDRNSSLHWAGNEKVRKGQVVEKSLGIATRLGEFEAPLEHAAYIVIGGGSKPRATLVMDGGDKLEFAPADSELTVKFEGGSTEKVPLSELHVVAFPRSSKPLEYSTKQGVIIEGDGCRLSLCDVKSKLKVEQSAYELSKIVGIEPGEEGQAMVVTQTGERLPADVAQQKIKATVPWAKAAIDVAFEVKRGVSMRNVNWAHRNSRGRLLAERLGDDLPSELSGIAQNIESPNWQAAVAELEKQKPTDSDEKQQVAFLKAVGLVRAGKFDAARAEFQKLAKTKKPNRVTYLSAAFDTVLSKNPNGKFGSEPLSEPDVYWRAETAAASELLAAVEPKRRGIEKLAPKKRIKALEELERDFSTINFLDVGAAQSQLLETLQQLFGAHVEEIEKMGEDIDKIGREIEIEQSPAKKRQLIRKHNDRVKQFEKMRQLRSKEIESIGSRYRAEGGGFSLQPPRPKE